MENYIKVLQNIHVYESHSFTSPIIKTFPPDTLITYNREKLREKTRWIEIYLEDGTTGYIVKKTDDIFICKEVELNDVEVTVFNFNIKKTPAKLFHEIFKQSNNLEFIASGGNIQIEESILTIKRLIDLDKQQEETVTLLYDKDEVDVNTFTLLKDETFFITGEPYYYNKSFYEVDNFTGMKGFILRKTSTTELNDKWINIVAMIVAILTVVFVFIGAYNNGWIVGGIFLLIPGFIAVFVVIIGLMIARAIIGGIVNMIRIRL
jgi:hypothetical protein